MSRGVHVSTAVIMLFASAGIAAESSIPDFDSSKHVLEHVSICYSPEEIERAKTAADPVLRAIRERLIAEADAALKLEVRPLDESWWKSASTRPWAQTYPEVFENTWVRPSAYATPAETLATAYLVTGRKAYADKAIALLMNLAPYSFSAEHYDVGMNYSVWGMPALRAYDIVMRLMTPRQRHDFDACMTRLARAVLRNDIYWIENNIGGGINNHLAWHKAMLGLLGMYYHRPQCVEYAMYGRRGMASLLKDGLVDHGLWRESSLNYQFAAIAPMMIFADAEERVGGRGIRLSELATPNGHSLKKACDAMFDVLAPDCLIPPIGDAYGRRQRLWQNPIYETAFALWGDAKYAWLIKQNPRPSYRLLFAPALPANAAAPPIRSSLWREHGYVFLRSNENEKYWNNPDALCAFLTYDRSGVHANADKLSLSLFGRGRMLLSDVEGRATAIHAFSSRIQSQLNRGALAQNTVMIDGRDQRFSPKMLDLIEYRAAPDEKVATVADGRGVLYDGVRQMRSIWLMERYVLDVFQVRCDKPRQIDWVMHVLDEKAALAGDGRTAREQAQALELPRGGAWTWLRDARSYKPAGDVRLEWREAEASVRLIMLNSGAERVILCGFPSTDQPDSPSIPMLIVRHRGDSAIFAALWLIGDGPKVAKLRQLSSRDGKLIFEVEGDGAKAVHLVPALR